MNNRIARVALVTLEIFLALTAIYGAIYVVPVQPRGLLAGSLFTDYTLPALGLGIVVGGGALAAAVAVVLRPRIGMLLSVLSGGSIIVFELVETSVVGFDVWLHAIASGPRSRSTSTAAWMALRCRSAFQCHSGCSPFMCLSGC